MDRNLWNQISIYQSSDLVKREYKRKHQLELNTEETWEIVSCFMQAREYFSNAEAADLSVKPLLLYYGVLALSRGIILFLDPNSNEATLKAGHGLKTGKWEEILVKSPREILNLEISPENGTFAKLSSVIESMHQILSPNTDGGVTITHIQRTIDIGGLQIITLNDLASRIEAVSSTYTNVTEKKPNFVLGSIENLGSMFGNKYLIRVLNDDVLGL